MSSSTGLMINRSSRQLAWCLLVLIVVLLSLVFSIRPLSDVDLGWHLAGGLWILNSGVIPIHDPFGAEGRLWVDYSWLFQVLVAALFQLGGFTALQLSQAVLVAITFVTMLYLGTSNNIDQGEIVATNRLESTLPWRELAAVSLCIPLLVPVAYLRPQLLSVLLFALLLFVRNTFGLKLLWVIPLTVVWVNVHVFWVVSPFVVFISDIGDGYVKKALSRAAAVFTAGLISPYGVDNYHVLWEYATNHSVAYSYIIEFQHLSPTTGLAFWSVMIVLLIAAPTCMKLLRHGPRFHCLLFLTFLIATIVQRKYLGLCAIAAIPVLMRSFDFLPLRLSQMNSTAGVFLGGRQLTVIVVLLSCFVGVAISGLELKPQLTPRVQAIIALSSKIDSDRGDGDQRGGDVILNHFNDGGWLALGLFLNRHQVTEGNQMKTAIDGRTLVMGERRIKEYWTIQNLSKGWEQVLEQWSVAWAILPKQMKLVSVLLDARSNNLWQVVAEQDELILLRKKALKATAILTIR